MLWFTVRVVEGRRRRSSAASSPPHTAEDPPPVTAASSEPAIDIDAPVREAEAWLAELRQMQLPTLPAQPTHPGARPDRYSYSDPDAYDQALLEYGVKEARWKTEQHLFDAAKEQIDRRQQAVGQAQFAVYQARRQRTMTRYADYVSVVERPDLPVTPAMAIAITKLPEGPELAHWLGQPAQKAEVERLSKIEDPAEVIGRTIEQLDAAITRPAPATTAASV